MTDQLTYQNRPLPLYYLFLRRLPLPLFILVFVFYSLASIKPTHAWSNDQADLAYSTKHSDNILPSCQAQFLNNSKPKYGTQKNLNMTQLCLQGFSVGYSQALRSPLWSAEYLTRERLEAARQLQRGDFFHEEQQLNKIERTSLAEYVDYDFDRGHLAPNFDMPTPNAQFDSFSLANVAPQASWHNRKLWADVERLTRYQVYQYDEAYVITGVAYLSPKRFNKQGLAVPSHFFKVVYLPSFAQAGVYWSQNNDTGHLDVISLNELKYKTALDAIPNLPEHIKNNALYLPTDVADPEVELNFKQSTDAAKSWWLQTRTFFSELWVLIKQMFT